MEDQSKDFSPPWKNRRIALILTTVFCAGIITYLTGWGADTRLNETIAQFAWITIIGNMTAYIFGSSFESIGIAKLRK